MQRQYDLSKVHVHIAIPVYGALEADTSLSLVETTVILARQNVSFSLVPERGCCYLDLARCHIVAEFLKTSATHLFMIDSDMGWKPEQFIRVLAHATVMDCVAATYRMKTDDEKYPVGLNLPVRVNEHGCVPAHGLGMGFCCIQRHVIEALAAKSPIIKDSGYPDGIPQVFRCDVVDGFYRGEDVAFFADMASAGFQSYLDLEVVLDHYGKKNYRGSFLEVLKAYDEQGGRPQVQNSEGTMIWKRQKVEAA
jgi:hypothetical protein